jgi:chemotaxis protein methyltransferase CheR
MIDLATEISRNETLPDKLFQKLSKLIYFQCGIKMPISKRTMLQARLQKRMRKLGIRTFSRYCDYLFSSRGMERELIHMIDVVTTNKTDFFREPKHFEFLSCRVLPELVQAQTTVRKRVKIWSAGCSTGEEPYTLAMVMEDFAEQVRGLSYSILATDISTKVLEVAKTGIYESEKVESVPLNFKKKYLLRSKDRNKNLVRIVPELRSRVFFQRLNFMHKDFGVSKSLDVIFCRNVMIYFDRETQEKLLNRFCKNLSNSGYVFIGHSETLHGLDVPLTMVSPTVYRKVS